MTVRPLPTPLTSALAARGFREWLRELVAEPEHEYPHFVAALSLIAALPNAAT